MDLAGFVQHDADTETLGRVRLEYVEPAMKRSSMIIPVKPPQDIKPVTVAINLYRKWKGRWFMGFLTFLADLVDHMLHGMVIARPDIFMMAKTIRTKDGEPGWFIRVATGNLADLLISLPFQLPTISFCRRGDERVREYKTSKLIPLIMKEKNHATKAMQINPRW
jgi:hypothetical protein